MIRALITDWGGVLMRTVDFRPRLAWERRLGLPPDGLHDLFFGGPGWRKAQHGQATIAEVWDEVAAQLALDDGDLAALQRDFWTGDQLDRELVALIGDLRRQGVRTALLSNFAASLPDLLAELGVDGVFDAVVVSGREGTAKPEPAIYERTLERLGVAPAEALFLDDMGPNVRTARQLGMTGVRFRGLRHLQRTLAAAGLPVEVPPLQPLPGIRAVIFDWGGVLSPLAFFQHTQEWEQRLNLTPGTLERVLWGAEWKRYEIGALSPEQYDAHVARGLGLPDRAAVQRFYAEYYADDVLDPRVAEAARALRGRYRTALLTNAFPGHADLVRDRYGFDPRAEFDVYVNSAEVGLAKPDPAIYQLTLDRLGVAPGETVFLDDMVRNTDAAQAMGIHTIVFTDADTGLADLAALLCFRW